MTSHVDIDWASDSTHRISVSSHCVFIDNVVVLWGSKKQNGLALSTIEVEYMALAYGVKEALWESNLINESSLHVNKPIPTLNDYRAAVFITTNPGSTKGAKHIDIKYHFVKDIIEQGDIILQHCSSKELVANIFTQPLDTHKFTKYKDILGLSSHNMLEHPPCGGD